MPMSRIASLARGVGALAALLFVGGPLAIQVGLLAPLTGFYAFMLGALLGGIVGAIVGTFVIPIPLVGSLIGALFGCGLGAIIGELNNAKDTRLKDTIKPAAGAVVGRILGTLAKLPCAIAVWVILSVAAFWR